MKTHKSHKSPIGTELERVQDAAYVASMRGPAHITSKPGSDECSPAVTIKVGAHVLLKDYEGDEPVENALYALQEWREERENNTGSRVWRYLLSCGRKWPTTALLVTAMQTEHPKDYPATDKGEARRRVEKELRKLLQYDLVEATGAGDQSPFRSKTAQWRAWQASDSVERVQQKSSALLRDLKECQKTLRLLRLLDKDANTTIAGQIDTASAFLVKVIEEAQEMVERTR